MAFHRYNYIICGMTRQLTDTPRVDEMTGTTRVGRNAPEQSKFADGTRNEPERFEQPGPEHPLQDITIRYDPPTFLKFRAGSRRVTLEKKRRRFRQ
jgi:hypothetical protein